MQHVTRGDHSRLPIPTSTRQPGGFLLITALMIITGLTALLTANLTQTFGNVLASNQSAASQLAAANREAGIAYARRVLLADFLDGLWNNTLYTTITSTTPMPNTASSPGSLPGTPPGQLSFSVTVTPLAGILATGGVQQVTNGAVLELRAKGYPNLAPGALETVVVEQFFNPWPFAIYLSGDGAPLGAPGTPSIRSRFLNGVLQDISGVGTVIADASASLDPSINPSSPPPNTHLIELGPGMDMHGSSVRLADPLFPYASWLVQDNTTGAPVSTTTLGLVPSLPAINTATVLPSPTLISACGGDPSSWPDLIINGLSYTNVSILNDPSNPSASINGSTVPRILCYNTVHLLNGAEFESDDTLVVYVAHGVFISGGSKWLAGNGTTGAGPPNTNTLLVIGMDDHTHPVGLSVQGHGSEFNGLGYFPTAGGRFGTDLDPSNPTPMSLITGAFAFHDVQVGSATTAATISRVAVNVGLYYSTELLWCEGACPTSTPPPPPPAAAD